MVTLYSKPECPQCDMSVKLLVKEGITFTKVDVTTDADALARVKELGYLQAPVLETADGKHWGGFKPERIRALKG